MHARRALAAAVAFAFAASLPSQPWVNYGCSFCENTAVDSPIASYCTDCDGLDISSTMVITWTNDNSTVDVVQFGTAPGTYSSTSAAPLYHSYSTPPVLGKKSTLPAFTSALIQRVTIIGLAPATRYFYRIGSDATGWSAEASFLSHPGVGANVPVKVLMLADMDVQCFDGKVCNPQAVRDALVLPSARAALGALGINGGAVFAGDLSYANGNQTHWDAWQEFIAPLSANLPIMTNAGNHEENTEPGFVAFQTRFGGMPYAAPDNIATGSLFYSYEVGPIRFVVLSAYVGIGELSPQTVFLKSTLAATDRSRTPWVVCVWHPPVYSSNTDHFMQHEDFRLAHEQTLLDFRVNAVFVGHVHAFQRTHMVFNNSVVDPRTGAGIYHLMAGISGKELYQTWVPQSFPWMAKRNASVWGTAVISANASHMGFTVRCAAFYDEAADAPTIQPCHGEVVDEFFFTNQLAVRPFTPTPSPTPSAAAAGAGASVAAAWGGGVAVGGAAAAVLGFAAFTARARAARFGSVREVPDDRHALVRNMF